MKSLATLSACLFITGIGSSAEAATTFHQYEFTGDFAGAPIPTLSGTFTVSRDSATGTGDLLAVDITVGGVRFDLSNSGGGRFYQEAGLYPAGEINHVGGITGRPFDEFNSMEIGVTDWAIVIDHADLNDSFFFYTLDGWSDLGSAFYEFGDMRWSETLVSDPSAGVPEPATWALMILGFGAVGWAMRRRQSMAIRFSRA